MFAGRTGGAAGGAPHSGLASQGSRRRSPTLLGSNGRRGATRPNSRHDVWPAEAGPTRDEPPADLADASTVALLAAAGPVRPAPPTVGFMNYPA
jgi:hypothetical protein